MGQFKRGSLSQRYLRPIPFDIDNFMTKLFALFLVLICWHVKLMAAQPEAILCMDNYPPFTYFNEGKPVGAMVDAMKIIAQRLHFTLKFTPKTPFVRCLRMAKAGKIDFVVSLMQTPERLTYMEMFPYASEEPGRLVVLKGTFGHISSEVDTLNLKIGLVKGFSYTDTFHKNRVDQVFSSSPEVGVRQLRAGRIDALLLNESVAKYLVQSEVEEKVISVMPIELLELVIPGNQNVNFIAISKKSNVALQLRRFAGQIETMRKDGTFTRLIDYHRNISN